MARSREACAVKGCIPVPRDAAAAADEELPGREPRDACEGKGTTSFRVVVTRLNVGVRFLVQWVAPSWRSAREARPPGHPRRRGRRWQLHRGQRRRARLRRPAHPQPPHRRRTPELLCSRPGRSVSCVSAPSVGLRNRRMLQSSPRVERLRAVRQPIIIHTPTRILQEPNS